MTASGYIHGNKAFYIDNEWQLADGTPAKKGRCPKCNEPPTPEGHDACLGYIPGVVAACCGHGVERPYVYLQEGTKIYYESIEKEK